MRGRVARPRLLQSGFERSPDLHGRFSLSNFTMPSRGWSWRARGRPDERTLGALFRWPRSGHRSINPPAGSPLPAYPEEEPP
jgi:hypothetical protein